MSEPHDPHAHYIPGEPAKPLPIKRGLLILGIIAVAVIAGGLAMRAKSAQEVRTWTDARATPIVYAQTAKEVAGKNEILLPGRLEAYSEAPIFARVGGYIKRWHVDIGSRVKSGQLMAEIDTPELSQQLEQAKADLANAQANETLAETTAKRWKNLRATDAVSQQETDQKLSDLAARSAQVSAAQANVSRMRALEAFRQVNAPFEGVVTARKTDVGALINAGSSNGTELFRVADVHVLRVSVRVPQNQAAKIKVGMTATLTVPEHPGKTFPATLKRTSGAISTASGTLLAELEVDNKDGLLTPGAYAEIRLGTADEAPSKRVPASALIFRKGIAQLGIVDSEGKVTLKKVQIGRDFGAEVEITAGLADGDRLIISPPDSLEEGDLVRVQEPKPDTPKPGKAG